jgi:ATP-dependent Clp protease ATP-binding subunit ClpB
LLEKEILNRLAVLILRGAIKDGETAQVVLEDGRVTVLPNHTDSEMEDDDDMLDEDEAMLELEDVPNGDMDLYE